AGSTGTFEQNATRIIEQISLCLRGRFISCHCFPSPEGKSSELGAPSRLWNLNGIRLGSSEIHVPLTAQPDPLVGWDSASLLAICFIQDSDVLLPLCPEVHP
ncbi:hypothetical protein LEMLEM_LOCUS5339, partial [Lemmus lemmus]